MYLLEILQGEKLSAMALAKHLSAQSQGRRVTKGFLTDTLSVSFLSLHSHWELACYQWTPILCSEHSGVQPIMVADRQTPVGKPIF